MLGLASPRLLEVAGAAFGRKNRTLCVCFCNWAMCAGGTAGTDVSALAAGACAIRVVCCALGARLRGGCSKLATEVCRSTNVRERLLISYSQQTIVASTT